MFKDSWTLEISPYAVKKFLPRARCLALYSDGFHPTGTLIYLLPSFLYGRFLWSKARLSVSLKETMAKAGEIVLVASWTASLRSLWVYSAPKAFSVITHQPGENS